jgi:hypothetical protein
VGGRAVGGGEERRTGKAQAGAWGRERRNPKQGKRCVVVARVFAGLSKGATTRADHGEETRL